MRVRVRYTKLDKIRFVSAIDLGRIWERSLRRADLPIAYSEGFSPHPKVSFPDALTLGYASTGEYAELTFAGAFDIDPAVASLNAALPDGMDVIAAVEVADGAPRLAKWLRASLWDIAYGEMNADLSSAVSGVLEAPAVIVDRERKDETTAVDVRPAIVSMCADDRVVRAVLHHTEPPARPQELHQALAQRAASRDFPSPTLVTRIAQGRASHDGVVEAITGTTVPVEPPPRQKANS